MLMSEYNQQADLTRGCIDEVRGDIVSGWLYSAQGRVKPLLFVDDTPALLVLEQQPRPDVGASIGTTDSTGFYFRLPYLCPNSVVSLYGVTPEGCFLVERKSFAGEVFETALLTQLEQAAALTQHPGAVAIVCWDGAHNPIARAKVLYDIAATRRPVVLFCYIHNDFGGKLWYPLRNSAMHLVCIPWEERFTCHKLIQHYGIHFNTIWICKPRLPSFMLAAQLGHAESKLILDIDDNEDVFIAAQGDSRTAYTQLGRNLAHALTARIPARTVTSASLQAQFGGHAFAPIVLSPDATPEGGYAVFAAAEQKALPEPALRALLPVENVSADPRPSVVLLWKQHDAGLYGRRVDQIARSVARWYPGHRVFILELYNEDTGYEREQSDFSAENARKMYSLEARKNAHALPDGVIEKALWYILPEELQRDFLGFLTVNGLLPENTLFVLFPIIQELGLIEDMLRPYRKIIDVVDNQISWATIPERQCCMLEQYFRLLAPAQTVVFNTEQTRTYFENLHFLDAVFDVRVIPNWYNLPEGVEAEHTPLRGKTQNIFYSGNMNDRIDWNVLHALAELPDVHLHLVGTADNAFTQLSRLLEHENVMYHGVKTEREALHMLAAMDVAILPHTLDAVSRFMNPIKMQMYKTVGIPVLCPELLGMSGAMVFVYHDAASCINALRSITRTAKQVEALWKKQVTENASYRLETEQTYMDLIGAALTQTRPRLLQSDY